MTERHDPRTQTAARDASEGICEVAPGEESMDPIVVSDLPSLLHLLGTLAPIVSASQY